MKKFCYILSAKILCEIDGSPFITAGEFKNLIQTAFDAYAEKHGTKIRLTAHSVSREGLIKQEIPAKKTEVKK